MSRPRYGVSPWSVSSAGKAGTFPAVPDLGEAEVVVIGGGLTGLLTTWGLKAAGRTVVLLEAGRLGAGDSLAASGLSGLLVTSDYRALESMHGRRIARTLIGSVAAAGPAMLAGFKKAKALVKYEPRPILSLLDAAVRGWERDAVAREAAGLEARALTGDALAKSTPAEVQAATRLPGGGLTEPAKTIAAAVIRASSAKVFERSPVTRITFTRTDATVQVETRAIRASRVVICTDAPGVLAPTLDRHVRAIQRYHVLTVPMPAAMRKAMALTGVIAGDVSVPFFATITPDGRLLLTGGDGPVLPERKREAALVQRTGDLMYQCLRRFPVMVGLAPEFSWSSSIVAAPDRFPLVGPHRQYPHQLFSFGTDGDPTLAWLASRILVRTVLGEATADDEVFGFGRVQEDRH